MKKMKLFILLLIPSIFFVGAIIMYPDNSSGSLTTTDKNVYITASDNNYITAISSSSTASYMRFIVTDLTANTDQTFLKYNTNNFSINYNYIIGHDYIINVLSTSGGYYLIEPA